ncbi:MAG: phage tail protein, partial [bacterium]
MDYPVRAIPNGWLECDGSAIPAGARYDDLREVLVTTNLPDLRGLFTRGAKTGEALLSKVNWTTGRPRNTAFTTDTQGNHAHSFQRGSANFSGDIRYQDTTFTPINSGGGGTTVGNGINAAGNHAHTVNGGGDAETAPDHARLVKCIKAFHIT